jgi:hypothetical protein
MTFLARSILIALRAITMSLISSFPLIGNLWTFSAI